MRALIDIGVPATVCRCVEARRCWYPYLYGPKRPRAGGVWLHLDVAGGWLYMGDCSVESGLYAYDPPPRAATVILDASYGSYDTALTACLDQFDRLFDAGPVLLPCRRQAAARRSRFILNAAGARCPT